MSTPQTVNRKRRELILTIAGYVFFACFVFPLEKHLDGWMIEAINLFTFGFAYAFLSHYLRHTLGSGKGLKFIFTVTAATLAGLLCRYLLEYGEISNIYNFTAFKVIGYTVAVIVYSSFYYFWSAKGKYDK